MPFWNLYYPHFLSAQSLLTPKWLTVTALIYQQDGLKEVNTHTQCHYSVTHALRCHTQCTGNMLPVHIVTWIISKHRVSTNQLCLHISITSSPFQTMQPGKKLYVDLHVQFLNLCVQCAFMNQPPARENIKVVFKYTIKEDPYMYMYANKLRCELSIVSRKQVQILRKLKNIMSGWQKESW